MVKEIEGTKLLRVIKNKNKRDNVITNNPIHKFNAGSIELTRKTERETFEERSGGAIWRYDSAVRSGDTIH